MIKFTKYLLLFLPLTLFGDFFIPIRNDWMVTYSFGLLYYISVLGYFNKSKSLITLKDFVYLFVLLFLCIVPFFQYSFGINVWNIIDYLDISYFKANLIIIIFLVVYSITYKNVKTTFKKSLPISNKSISILKINSISIIIFIYLFSKYNGFTGLSLARNDFESITLSDNNTIHNLIEMTTRTILFFNVISNYFYFKYSKSRNSILLFILSLIMMLIIVNPLNIPRYLLVTFYLPLLLIISNPYKYRPWFKISFVFAVLVVFPLMGVIRTGFDLSNLDILFTVLSTGSFDSHSMLVQGVEYYFVNNFSFGYQLLGSIFFFVPRFIWPTKPVGTGEFLGIEEGFYFTNVSYPFIGEGFANFGFLGVIIFAFFLAIVHKKFDLYFWSKSKFNFDITSLFYLCFIGLTFFMMRGDFLSSFAYTFSIYMIMKSLNKII
jgi:oligosaccharide repeat unit polymerase